MKLRPVGAAVVAATLMLGMALIFLETQLPPWVFSGVMRC